MSAIADSTDAGTVHELAQAVTELRETVSAQADLIEQQADRLDAQADRIAELEREVEVQSSNVAGAHNRIGDVVDRVESLENATLEPDSGDATPIPDGAETGTQAGGSPATPLEQLVALPEHVAARELSANQERARFIAHDVRDYAEKAPAGLVIDSSTVKNHRRRRLEATYADCGPRHGFPRRHGEGRRRADEAPRKEAHRIRARRGRPAG